MNGAKFDTSYLKMNKEDMRPESLLQYFKKLKKISDIIYKIFIFRPDEDVV